MPMNEIQKNLFKNAMHGNWEQVIKIYDQNPQAHTAKITRSGETAIHIAVSDGQELIVQQLVNRLVKDSGNPLGIRNDLGKTPLHLAASSGNVAMCKCIAEQDPELIGIRDKDDETPFFLAVRHGRKDIFLCLHNLCENGDGSRYCRRKDGETILHSAIAGEYFDLAFQIIYLYEKLVNSVNEEGFSPLHLLASKPSAFRSGSHIRGFHKIIYHCIIVDKLQHASNHNTLSEGLQYNEASAKYPENYQSCVGFSLFLRNLTRMLLGYGNHGHHRTDHISDAENPTEQKAHGTQLFPSNYLTCFLGLKLISKSMLVILGLGSRGIVKVRERKEKHAWSVQIMEELLKKTYMYEYEANGRSPHHLTSIERDHGETTPYSIVDGRISFRHDSFIEPMVHDEHDPTTNPPDSPPEVGFQKSGVRRNVRHGNGKKEGVGEMEKRETPILIAAKKGVLEMVERMLELLPIAIHDTNTEKKNVVLLAVEHRQPHVYNFLLGLKIMKETIFRQTDMDGNSALHLAAKLGDHRPWLIPGAALQMQWEIKWYEFVKNSMPPHFFVRYNKQNQSPKDLFSHSHKNLVQEGGRWLTKTSESCSVVAALIATVAFATSATVPGGVNQESGIPILEAQSAFSVFAISSLVALSFSVTSVVMFLAILTSRYQEKDFGKDLPRKLLLGLTSLFVSIASMLLSFCAGHFFVLKDKLKYAAFPVYAVSCLPVTLFAMAQFPLYFDLVRAMFKKVPHRSAS